MKHISKLICNSALFALALAPAAWSSTATTKQWLVDLDQGSGNVEFRATGHPSALKIIGKGTAPRGNFTVDGKKVTGTVLFDLTSLDTGIETRTHHMKEKYLETEKFRDAKLTVSQMTLPQDLATEQFSADQVPFTGSLLLHGVERPVSGIVKIDKAGGKISMAAQFGLKISDYKIAVPSFAGITMADDVQVAVADSAPVVVMTQKLAKPAKQKRKT